MSKKNNFSGLAVTIPELLKNIPQHAPNVDTFQSVLERMTTQFGPPKNRTSSYQAPSHARGKAHQTERATWPTSFGVELVIDFDSLTGIFVVLDDEEQDYQYLWQLTYKPKTKKEKVPLDLLTPERFSELLDNAGDLAKATNQADLIVGALRRMLGDPDRQSGNSDGSGSVEWYVPNAELVCSWSKKGMTLKLKDSSL